MKRRLTNKQKQKLEIKAQRRLAKNNIKTGLTPISAIIPDMCLSTVVFDDGSIVLSFSSELNDSDNLIS